MAQEYEYYAFISYSRKDEKWAERLQKKLESYRLPSIIRKQNPDFPKKFKVFRDKTDIRIGTSLQQILHEELEKSKYLIVVCSPFSAQSEWVGKEIADFLAMGKKENIILFIIDGTPYSNNPETECYHPVIKEHFPAILGANIYEEGNEIAWIKREKAFIRIIAGMLDLNFDLLWNRHRRYFFQKVISFFSLIIIFIIALGSTWYINQTIDVQMKVHATSMLNAHLPPLKNALITIRLDNETKQDTLNNTTDTLHFNNIPAKYKNKPVKVNFKGFGFEDLDTMLILEKTLSLPIKRNPVVYGSVVACLYDIEHECPVPDTEIEVEGEKTRTDKKGYLHLFFPLSKQRTFYKLKASVELLDTCIYMPCDSNAIIRTK